MQFPHVESLDQGVWHRRVSMNGIRTVTGWVGLGLLVTACGVAGEVSGDGTLEGSASSSTSDDSDSNVVSDDNDTDDQTAGEASDNNTDTSNGDDNDTSDDVAPPNTSNGTSSPVTPTSSNDDIPDAPTETSLSFSCDETARPPVATLRRLTMQEYSNTVRDLVVWATGDGGVSNSVASILEALPADQREPVPQDVHGSYRRLIRPCNRRTSIACTTWAARLAHCLPRATTLQRSWVGARATTTRAMTTRV